VLGLLLRHIYQGQQEYSQTAANLRSVERVRVGLLGCGGFQRYRAGNLLKVPEAEVAALCDCEPSQIEAMRAAHPSLADVPTFSGAADMISANVVDAIFIATPHTQHVDQILAGLNAGLHVLCEKPLVTSVADAKRVIEARDRAGKQGMVSYQRHFQPEFRYIRQRIASGEAGKVTYVSALQCQEWKRATKGTWRQQASLSGGGQLNDSGSHLVDILLWTTGLRAEQVSAFIDNRGTEVDIDSAVSLRFAGGALGSLTVVGDAHRWHEDITIWCEKQTFFVRDGALSIVNAEGSRFKAENLPGGGTPDANFVAAILGKGEVESPFECGLEVIRLTEAAWQSAAQGGKPVAVTA
jgi:predicted dehydrogenase